MINHFNTLIDVGFFCKADDQFYLAQNLLHQSTMMDPDDEEYHDDDDDYDEFQWNFNIAEKKADFDFYYEELGLSDFIVDQIDILNRKDDGVLIVSTPEGYVYCGYQKRDVVKIAQQNFNRVGLLPYYTTKRKIKNKIVWFCLTWSIIPFDPPNYN
jgi:hypothetical protein